MKLYHGGEIELVEDSGLFRGVFASARDEAARSHGRLHYVDIDDAHILTNYALNYELEHDAVKAAFRAVCKEEGVDPDSEIAWAAVVEDEDVFDMDACEVLEAFEPAMIGEESVGMAGWVAQRMRGQVARKLGYQAVEMNDEHGTSYLVLPGVEFEEA